MRRPSADAVAGKGLKAQGSERTIENCMALRPASGTGQALQAGVW
jgi:hypothetical protein